MCVLKEIQPHRQCMGEIQLEHVSAETLPAAVLQRTVCAHVNHNKRVLQTLLGGRCFEKLLYLRKVRINLSHSKQTFFQVKKSELPGVSLLIATNLPAADREQQPPSKVEMPDLECLYWSSCS